MTDTTFTSYNIDDWYIQFPQEWKMSLDKETQPPQVVFDVSEEPVTIYLSTWNFQKPETKELATAETILSFALHAFEQQGIARMKGMSEYCPDGFLTCIGQGATSDGYQLISCFICTEGRALSVYIVYADGVDFEKYLSYIRKIELN